MFPLHFSIIPERDSSGVKNIYCSERPRVQFPAHGCSWLTATLAPGDLLPSSGPSGHHSHRIHTYTVGKQSCTHTLRMNVKKIVRRDHIWATPTYQNIVCCCPRVNCNALLCFWDWVQKNSAKDQGGTHIFWLHDKQDSTLSSLHEPSIPYATRELRRRLEQGSV